MKTSEVLRKAAKLLEWQMTEAAFRNGGCGAIDSVIGWYWGERHEKAHDRLRFVAGDIANNRAYWFGRTYKDDCQNHRIVALCLAAAIAESEGD